MWWDKKTKTKVCSVHTVAVIASNSYILIAKTFCFRKSAALSLANVSMSDCYYFTFLGSLGTVINPVRFSNLGTRQAHTAFRVSFL